MEFIVPKKSLVCQTILGKTTQFKRNIVRNVMKC